MPPVRSYRLFLKPLLYGRYFRLLLQTDGYKMEKLSTTSTRVHIADVARLMNIC